MQVLPRDKQGGDAKRDVDVEDPSPRESVDKKAADQRPDHARGGEHAGEIAHVLWALPWREDVPENGERHREQAATADPLDAAEQNQLRHRLGNSRQHRADEKDDDRYLEDLPAPVDVADLSKERHACGGGQQVGGEHPGDVVEPAKVADNSREGRRDDRRIEGAQEEANQQRPQDQPEAFTRIWHAKHRTVGAGGEEFPDCTRLRASPV